MQRGEPDEWGHKGVVTATSVELKLLVAQTEYRLRAAHSGLPFCYI